MNKFGSLNRGNETFSLSKSVTPTYKRASDQPSKTNYSDATKRYENLTREGAVQGIVNAKNSYNNAKARGDKAAMDYYHQSAEGYRNWLRENGFGSDADYLENADLPSSSRYASDVGFDKLRTEYRDTQYGAIDNTVDDAVSRYNQQKVLADQNYSDATKRAYVEYMRQRNALPQQLKASGITGGVSETSNVALANNYGQTVNEFERERLNTLQDIDLSIAETKRAGETQKRQVDADLANQHYNLLLQRDSQDWQAGENEKTRKESAEQYYAGLAQNQSQFEQSQAQNQEQFDKSHGLSEKDFDLRKSVQEWTQRVTEQQISSEELVKARDWAVNAAGTGNFKPLAEIFGITEEQARDNYMSLMQAMSNMPYIAQSTYGKAKTSSYTPAATGQVTSDGYTSVEGLF